MYKKQFRIYIMFPQISWTDILNSKNDTCPNQRSGSATNFMNECYFASILASGLLRIISITFILNMS